ncbi:very-long-chain 3-oxoacyl-CoA reductase-like [Liolophura sinensis]|uniref:very-long-chain 3-oxoacyl-CoA reductase-like n=1 Tax=Liolophura sinensis TaxID=3198878 RepID=UPI0031595FAD
MMRAFLGSSTDVFTLIGVACAAYLSFKFLRGYLNGIKTYFLARSLGLSTNIKRMGSWAVVTGATDGIGKAYAEQIAEQGINVVLISRSLDKLQNVAKEIESKSKVKVKTVAVDFSQGIEIYARVRTELDGLDIGVLVNNVGMGYPCPGRILDFDHIEKMSMDLINVNITSMTMMTNLVLPGMVNRKKGVIINLSSMSAMKPTPMLSIYSAAKAYADFYSACVHEEYKSKGVIVQSVLPGFVATNMSGIKKTSLQVPSPTTFVRSALATVGVQNRTNGYWVHDLLGKLIYEVMPTWLFNSMVMSTMAKHRAKFLRKQQQQSKTD